MNQSKLQQLERALTGIEKKVYDAIPIQEWVTIHDIVSSRWVRETRSQFSAIHYMCIRLVERGLGKEREGKYQRMPAHQSEPKQKEITVTETLPKKTELRAVPAPTQNPYQQLRSMINDMATTLADMERIVDQMESDGVKVQRLREALEGLKLT